MVFIISPFMTKRGQDWKVACDIIKHYLVLHYNLGI